MAITDSDFQKIWASTSPLTPYEFSDVNYKQGWNFIGSTPPARQMWDFLQKQNDEKTQWLYSNKLSLSGGTMSGTIVCSGDNLNVIKRDNGNDGLCIIGGDKDNVSGATLQLFGQTHSSYAGRFYLRASTRSDLNDTSHPSVDLVGYPDGHLFWNDKEIERVNSSGSNYIRYNSGLQICFGGISISGNGDKTITYGASFATDNPNCVLTSLRYAAQNEQASIFDNSPTGFKVSLTNAGTNNHTLFYCAIGYWK